jgi:hypothetical protein
MTDQTAEFRALILRARSLGKVLLTIYETQAETAPTELLELLDIAEARLERAGYKVSDPAADNAIR